MIKKIVNYSIRICLIIAVVFSYFVTPEVVEAATAETLGDLRREYESKLAEKQANDQKIENAEGEIQEQQAAINKANEEISLAEDQYDAAEEAIVESNENIESLTGEAEKVLLYMQQMQGQNAYVEYVTGASSMTELIMRVEAVSQVTGYIQTTTKNLEDEIKRNEELKVELTEKQEALEKQVVEYEATIARYYDDIAEYDSYAQDIDAQVLAAKEDYETNRRICIQNLGEANVNDSTLLSSCSSVPVNGSWTRPLQSGVITSLIGSRWGRYHNALDLGGNAEGTPVYAAAAGTVVATYYQQECGGNEVFIYSYVDGQYYTHFYYHLLSYNVSVGDVVDQNTIIGYVGGGRQTSSAYGGYDTCTTGAHLHFGITEGRRTSHTTNVLTTIPGFNNYVGYRWYSRVI